MNKHNILKNQLKQQKQQSKNKTAFLVSWFFFFCHHFSDIEKKKKELSTPDKMNIDTVSMILGVENIQ